MPQDTHNQRNGVGLLSLDRTHMFTLNFIYGLPFFKAAHGPAGFLRDPRIIQFRLKMSY